MRALAKDPAQRFATADEFLQALRLTPAIGEEGSTYALPLPASPAASARTPVSAAAHTPHADLGLG